MALKVSNMEQKPKKVEQKKDDEFEIIVDEQGRRALVRKGK